MRPIFLATLLGGVFCAGLAQAQDVQDRSESSDTATHSKRPSTRATDSLFENAPGRAHALEEAQREAAERQKSQKPVKPDGEAPATPRAPAIPTVQAVPPGPPQKNLRGDEFRLLHAGSTIKDVLSLLGPPSSRLAIPDDDGHLRETLQYRVNGAPAATIFVQDGHVVQIETKQK